MGNKRGQFFGAYLVVLALMMCGIVVGLFYLQQGNALLNSLVSPKAVLEVRDGLDVFEMREVNLAKESFAKIKKSYDFCSDEFSEEFRDDFIRRVLMNEEMKKFIFEDLTFKGISIEDTARLESLSFFENILYPSELGDCEGGTRSFIRANVGKYIKLKGEDQSKINFPVDFSFEFGREYSISKNGEVMK